MTHGLEEAKQCVIGVVHFHSAAVLRPRKPHTLENGRKSHVTRNVRYQPINDKSDARNKV